MSFFGRIPLEKRKQQQQRELFGRSYHNKGNILKLTFQGGEGKGY